MLSTKSQAYGDWSLVKLTSNCKWLAHFGSFHHFQGHNTLEFLALEVSRLRWVSVTKLAILLRQASDLVFVRRHYKRKQRWPARQTRVRRQCMKLRFDLVFRVVCELRKDYRSESWASIDLQLRLDLTAAVHLFRQFVTSFDFFWLQLAQFWKAFEHPILLLRALRHVEHVSLKQTSNLDFGSLLVLLLHCSSMYVFHGASYNNRKQSDHCVEKPVVVFLVEVYLSFELKLVRAAVRKIVLSAGLLTDWSVKID